MTMPRLFAFWTGDNPMSDNRKRGFESFGVTGLEPTLLFADDLPAWIKPHHPLHPAYGLLHATHRSDYLRPYFLYHYGGGYADLKVQTGSWLPSVDRVESSSRLIGAGYREIRGGAAQIDRDEIAGRHYLLGHRVGRPVARTANLALRAFRPLLVGNCAFYFKPGQPMIKQWLDEVERRLDDLVEPLRANPPTDVKDQRQRGTGYPVPWSFLMGSILAPLSLANAYRIDRSLPAPKFTDYV